MANRTLQIVSAREARAIKSELPHLRTGKYCGGRYQWHGKASAYNGREIQHVPESVHCIWVERRQDKEGPYALLMCLYEK